MKIKNFSTYEFKQYNVVGVKAKINFAKTNNLEIISMKNCQNLLKNRVLI